jgi:SAM-dependent methyltransferase
MMNFSVDGEKRRDWWQTPLGQAFIHAETIEVSKIFPTLFGYHLLLLGESSFIPTLANSPITHKVWIHVDRDQAQNCSELIARHDKLPIIADSVDVIYLAHRLAFVNNPHEALREAFRILIPEGHLIISNFNPWSLWGLWRWITRRIKRSPWDGQFISITRLKDWLALLGFEVIQVDPFFFRPPIAHLGLLRHLEWLEKMGRWCYPYWGGGYVLLAKKRIITLTPIRPVFNKQEKVVVTGVVEPVRTEG